MSSHVRKNAVTYETTRRLEAILRDQNKKTRRGGRPGHPQDDPATARPVSMRGISVGLPKETKATLGLLSRLLGDPQWRILTDAITSLEAGLPKADKQMLARMRQR